MGPAEAPVTAIPAPAPATRTGLGHRATDCCDNRTRPMRDLEIRELKAVSGGAKKPNYGGGPGNSGPGDKNGKNVRGHGGQPTDR